MSFQERSVCGLLFSYDDALHTPHGFSTRLGGVSEGAFASLNLGLSRGDRPAAVRENFSRFCAALGVEETRLVFSRQVHGETVRCCTHADAGIGLCRAVPYEADALVTGVPGLPLVIFTADCIPVLLWDAGGRAVGAVHAGWRGTALGLPGKTAEVMVSRYGCRREDLRAAIGPGISRCCFETDADVPHALLSSLGEGILPFLDVLENGKYRADLKGINAWVLRRAGLLEEHISVSPDCTACLGEKYWSHRRLGQMRGSMASLIALGDAL